MAPAESEPTSDALPAAAPDRLVRLERLLRSNELLVAGLIHDLRTPLMAINLSAEIALMRSHAEAVEQAARRIKNSGERMSRLFDHLLNLSRRSTDMPRLDLRRGDLREVLGPIVEAWPESSASASVDVRVDGDSVGVFDASLLRLAIGRIVATLLEHAPPGAIAIELDGNHPDRIWLRVRTAGVISPEVQEALYVPQVPRGGLELPGIGLGLAEVDPLVRAHGGSVIGRSRVGSGTEYEMLLPRDASASL